MFLRPTAAGRVVSAAALVLLTVLPAAAQPQRTYVAREGNDLNPCSVGSPCRTFNRAIQVVAAGGEVLALNSGGYGVFTVNKPVAVAGAPGVYAAITVFSGRGIDIDLPSTGTVVLHNLVINGLGGDTGIVFRAGEHLRISQCRLSNLSFAGMALGSATADSWLVIEDCLVRNCGTVGIFCVRQPPFSLVGALKGVTLERNPYGFVLIGGGNVTMRDSLVALNHYGVMAGDGGNSLALENCQITGSVIAVRRSGTVDPGGTVVALSHCNVSNNLFALHTEGGDSLVSLGNNTVLLNIAGEAFTSTRPLK